MKMSIANVMGQFMAVRYVGAMPSLSGKNRGDALMSLSLYQFQSNDVDKIKRQKAGLIGSEMG